MNLQSIGASIGDLCKRDIVHALLMSIGGGALKVILDTVNAGSFDFDLKKVGAAALAAGGLYLSKQFFSNENGQFLGKI
jgi:hypothetical protein